MTQPARDGGPQQPAPTELADGAGGGSEVVRDRVVVVTPEGMAVSGATDEQPSPTELIEQPAKVMRIGEHDQAAARGSTQCAARRGRPGQAGADPQPVDRRAGAGARPRARRGAQPHRAAVLGDETPSDAELRIAQAQLVGWLEGLFHGIQTALFAQQMAARAQLEQMRRALPGPGGLGRPGMVPQAEGPEHPATGQYL